MKYARDFEKSFREKPVFTAVDARVFLTSRGASAAYARLFLSNAVKSGKVKRLKRGFYSFSDDADLVGYAFTPSYHGLQDALSIHGLWEQETVPVLITPRRVQQGIRTILGSKVIVRRIARKMFFGFESVRHGNGWVVVSSVEKTLIDFAYFKQHLSRETINEFKKRIDDEKLAAYLKKTPARARKRVWKMMRRREPELKEEFVREVLEIEEAWKKKHNFQRKMTLKELEAL